MKGIDVLCVLVLFMISAASELASVSNGDIQFGIDTALYSYTSADTLVLEVYEQLNLDQFSLDQDSIAGFSTTVILITENGDTAAVNQWNSEVTWTSGRSVVNSIVLPVLPGNYLLTVYVTDLGNGKQGSLIRSLEVEPAGTISEIELARALVPSPDESVNPLRKGEVLVFPAADGSYTLPEEHMVYYYVEIYNLSGSQAEVRGRLETASGETIFARPWISVTIPDGADAVGLVDSLDLRAARNSGLHRVFFALIAGDDTLEVSKDLMVARNLQSLDSYYIESTSQTEEIPYPDHFRLILTASETELFDSLNEDAKIRFYSTYWEGVPDERRQFEERCGESERYSHAQRESWETDRGRVYVIYGPPDDIETELFQGEQVPYEIWYYYGGGNESFVFADRNGTGNFEQVYSTVEGEVSYTNWEQMIAPLTGTSGG